jgi:hypothetical protein
MKKSSLEIIKMALSGKYVFHGSPSKFNVVKASENIRRGKNGNEYYIKYRGTSVHATSCLYAALSYLALRKPGYTTSVSLYENENAIGVGGPTTKQDAVKELFGAGGYLYVLPRESFVWFEGLGDLEMASFHDVKPVKRFHLTYEDWDELMNFLGTKINFDKSPGRLRSSI